MRALKAVAPEIGSYASEIDYFEAAWQRALRGDHYARLRAVEAKYDLGAVLRFFTHHGVGREDWSADGFTWVGGR